MENNKRKFTGLWIPRHIVEDSRLTPLEKMLYAEIDALDQEDGCFANNKYLSEILGCSEDTVSRYVSHLIEIGYVLLASFDGRQRRLNIVGRVGKNTEAASASVQTIYNKDKINNNTPTESATPTATVEPTATGLNAKQKVQRFFACFWSVYPSKMHYDTVFQIFNRLVDEEGEDAAVIKAGCERWAEWFKSGKVRDKKFLPFPSNFLEQKRYMDEDCPQQFVPTAEIVARENVWEAKKKQYAASTPAWATKNVEQFTNLVKIADDSAVNKAEQSIEYLRRLADIGDNTANDRKELVDGTFAWWINAKKGSFTLAESKTLWEQFWKSPCFYSLGKPKMNRKELDEWYADLKK